MTQPPQYPGTPDPSDQTPGGQDGGTPPPVPPQQPSYGAPQQPPVYGAPPPQQPGYGAPQQPPPYGASAFPAGPGGQDEPSKGLAIASLVLSFFACTIIAGLVSLVLAVMVLLRGKDGRNHGKGMAIAAIVINVLVMIGTVLFIVLVAVGVASMKDVDDLKAGDCISAEGLTDIESDTVEAIEDKDCTEEHDGEVLLSKELTADEAAAYTDSQTSVCVEGISSDPALQAKMESRQGLTVIALTEEVPPEAGDTVACVAYLEGGGTLTDKLG
ncbi:DUF4190 domain-containing protein [Nocardioides dongkuii]|uniref:DUF4190 domain-containing protein n=1 Tax=Nocardioides dongkuii TaxID=2760089 RepID=UPI0015FD3883|nr:DUF4190 domain-containing protein [Nocardioides dongkuii]